MLRKSNRLAWADVTPTEPYANFGDALSPIVVESVLGPVSHANFDESGKLAAVGSILEQLSEQTVVWGTGVGDPAVWPRWKPADLQVKALRGRLSDLYVRRNGGRGAEVFGDPGLLVTSTDLCLGLPTAGTIALGIMPHFSLLTHRAPNAPLAVDATFHAPDTGFSQAVQFISPITSSSGGAGQKAVVEQIAQCRRLVTSSLHGFVVAVALGVRVAWIQPCSRSRRVWESWDSASAGEIVNHRLLDFWSAFDSLPPALVWRQEMGVRFSVEDMLERIDGEDLSFPFLAKLQGDLLRQALLD